jgi:hypothetical protein
MERKFFIFFTTVCATVSLLCFAFFFASCSSSTADDSESTEETEQNSTATEATRNSSTRDLSNNSDDVVTNTTFANTIYLDLTNKQYGTSSADTAMPTSSASTITDNITILNTDGFILIKASKSTGATKIIMSGTLNTGTVSITSNASYAIGLYLNDVSITSGNYPCIEVTKASRTFVVLSGTNTLVDGRTYGTPYGTGNFTNTASEATDDISYTTKTIVVGENTKGSLFSKGQLLFSGDGSLAITTAYKHSIYSKDYIRIFGGTITTTNSGRNGIQCVNGFVMDGGTVTITGTGKNTNNESRGIIVEGQESITDDDGTTPYGVGEGFIIINGGALTINTYSKAMSAKWDIDEDYESTTTDDDPYPYVKINGGTISITTNATPQDDSSSAYTFTDADGVSVTEKTSISPEGIEGKEDVFINGGTLTLNCTDDCINASNTSGKVVITGGSLYCFSSDNDAIDSNGTLTISGGTIVAVTTTNPECAYDCDSNTFTITGGLFVGIGTSNFSNPTVNACTQNAVVMAASYAPAGATTAICASDGTPVFAYTVPTLTTVASIGGSNTYDVILLSSPNIASSTSYYIYNNATVTGGSTFHGLYLAPTSCTGTKNSTSFTTSTTVTTVGSVSNGGAQEGSHPNGGPGSGTF